MAIWEIPEQYIIDYSQDGEDLDGLAFKTKYCLEEAFKSLKELHDTSDKIIESINASIGIDVSLEDPQDGQLLVYRESDSKFHNETYAGGISSGTAQNIEHLTRLVNNLYLVLDVAELNPGGYDGLSGETFYGDSSNVDTTSVVVTDLLQGSDEITVNSTNGLIEGSSYLLTDGETSEWVKIAQIVPSSNLVVLKEAVTEQFATNATNLIRSYGTIEEGKISGNGANGAFFTTKVLPFVDSETGEEKIIRRANLIVKHQNIADAEITAEIALRPATIFVKGEVIGIGDGAEHAVTVSHTEKLTRYNFALYFDGIKQTQNYSFDTETGRVAFLAPQNAIVSVDYFYNWGEETFANMAKVGKYPDRNNPKRATTQFAYTTSIGGKVATIRLGLNRGTGDSENEIVSTGTGKPKGFKLAHHARGSTIQVTPSTATFNYNSELDTVVVTAPLGEAISISYSWRGRSFSVDSFVCMFNE